MVQKLKNESQLLIRKRISSRSSVKLAITMRHLCWQFRNLHGKKRGHLDCHWRTIHCRSITIISFLLDINKELSWGSRLVLLQVRQMLGIKMRSNQILLLIIQNKDNNKKNKNQLKKVNQRIMQIKRRKIERVYSFSVCGRLLLIILDNKEW